LIVGLNRDKMLWTTKEMFIASYHDLSLQSNRD